MRWNMINVKAATDDQTRSLSGCPVTEVYSWEMFGKPTGFSQDNLCRHSTGPNKGSHE